MLSSLSTSVDTKVASDCLSAARRVSNHYPLEYVLGYADFLGLRLRVNEDVLIPRPDTETLVIETEKVINQKCSQDALGIEKAESMRVLDMCTGSGCIAISLKKRNPKIEVVASDISERSLYVARENANTLNTAIKFVESDCFENIKGEFDVITCNPPYIKTSLLGNLEQEISYEPRAALDGGETGMDFYERVAQNYRKFIKLDGVLLLEIESQDEHTVKNLKQLFTNAQVDVINDMSNRPRVAIVKESCNGKNGV